MIDYRAPVDAMLFALDAAGADRLPHAVGAMWARLEARADAAPEPQQTRVTAAFYRDSLLDECSMLANRVRASGLDLARPQRQEQNA